MDALELALHCSSLLMRTMTKDHRDTSVADSSATGAEKDSLFVSNQGAQEMDESDCERHFEVCGRLLTTPSHPLTLAVS